MSLFVVRLDIQKILGSSLEKCGLGFVGEEGKRLDRLRKGLPWVPRRAGENVGWEMGKWELGHGGRVGGLPGTRGWSQDTQVPPKPSITWESQRSHTHFYFAATVLKKWNLPGFFLSKREDRKTVRLTYSTFQAGPICWISSRSAQIMGIRRVNLPRCPWSSPSWFLKHHLTLSVNTRKHMVRINTTP